MSLGMTSAWYAIMVKPRAEFTVSEALRLKGYDEFLPVITQQREWSDRLKTLKAPLFPRYIFCRFRFDQRVPILNTQGVNRIVSLGATPSPIPDYEIENLRTAQRASIEPVECEYIPSGQKVRVEGGPLCGLEGVFVEARSGCRVVISVHLLQRSAYVEMDRASVRPLATPNSPQRSQVLSIKSTQFRVA
jgi:transcription elongation factor/antiterminator RfaH